MHNGYHNYIKYTEKCKSRYIVNNISYDLMPSALHRTLFIDVVNDNDDDLLRKEEGNVSISRSQKNKAFINKWSTKIIA